MSKSKYAIALLVAVGVSGCGKKDRTPAVGAEIAEPGAEPKEQLTATGEVYVPNEHKKGKSRWKDAGVYLDGKPLAVLWFAEMPPAMKPVWIEHEMELPYKPGSKGPRTKTIAERRYRLAEYLELLGINLKKIKEIHLHGGSNFALRVTRADILKYHDTFYFNFGRNTGGKPLLRMADGFVANTSLDIIHGIAVYEKKQPPKISEASEVIFQGKVYSDVPYLGEPKRGGVRVYKDDTIGVWIKRRLLDEQEEFGTWFETVEGKELRWPLLPFLERNGLATSDIVVAEVIIGEQRGQRFDKGQLATLFFTTSPQGRGRILLGTEKVPANALALYTTLQPERAPAPVPDNAQE